MTLNHVLLTRYNLPSRGFESLVRAQEGWLRKRVALFERYCLPSVRAQSNKNFRWIIYFDPESPPWLLDKIDEWSRDKIFEPFFRAEVSHQQRIDDIVSVVGSIGTELITTNLDNDDGLAVDFIQRLQGARQTSARTALYLGRGLIKSDRGVYLRVDKRNAFCSVRETWDAPVTCWSEVHEELGRHMPLAVLDGGPGWLQVIHGTNVSNRVRGRMVSPMSYQAVFPGLIDDVDVPTRLVLARDLLFSRPTRSMREASRGVAKRGVKALLGRNGADRVKSMWASWTA